MKSLVVLGMASLLLTACGIGGAAIETAGNGCDWTDYILISQHDTFTPETAEQILLHNQTREVLCEGG